MEYGSRWMPPPAKVAVAAATPRGVNPTPRPPSAGARGAAPAAGAADGRGGVGLDGRAYSELAGRARHVFEAYVGGELHKDRVVRLGHRLGGGEPPPAPGVVVHSGVVLVLEAEV